MKESSVLDLEDTGLHPKMKKTKNFYFSEKVNLLVKKKKSKRVFEKKENDDLKSNFVSIFKWLRNNENRNLIKHRFFCFLFGINDEKFGTNFYIEKIKNLFSYNEKSLIISFLHLVIGDPLLAIWLIDEPEEILSIFQESCYEISKDIFKDFSIKNNSIWIRISELPTTEFFRNCKGNKINQLIKIKGVAVSKTEVFSNFNCYKLICLKCLEIQKTLFFPKDKNKAFFTNCFNCKSQGPFQINWTQTENSNFQKILLQELAEFTPVGSIQSKKEVILKNDLIDYVKLGEEITVTGILKYSFLENGFSMPKNRFFTITLEANFIEKPKSRNINFVFSFSEERVLKKIFKKKQILNYLLDAFIPSIKKKKTIKLPLLLSLFGFEIPKKNNNFLIKSGINILVIGDPSSGKSQMLKGFEKLAPKSIFLTGQGSSTKGLTASLKYETISEDWILEGGALVFADKGFCLIDGVEKLGVQDHIFLMEAMDHQTISIKKNGISNILKTRCTVIATSSPIEDYYRSENSFSKNFPGEENFIEKFDILISMRDIIDPLNDDLNGKFIICSHRNASEKKKLSKKAKILQENFFNKENSNFFNPKEKISQKLFKKYILYARNLIKPKLNPINQEFITNFYVLLKNESLNSNISKLSLRHLETIIRLAESSTRLHLREISVKEDISISISVFLFSFIESQPASYRKNLLINFGHYLNLEKDTFEKISKVLRTLMSLNLNFNKNHAKIEKKFF
mmetsp:Transcript_21524/g.49913  ORF Transcript_21524/g.49913 Transcript_21524/m.49913 type:complete len:740 (+) Transcript_21524:72-2291(+)